MAGYFNHTCDVIDLTFCDVGNRYLDPCDCRKYFQCEQHYGIISRDCGPGTLYKPGSDVVCDNEKTVRVESCNRNPWDRCNVTASRLLYIEELCTSTTPASSTTISTQPTTPATESPLNAGMVAGLIIAGMVLALIVIAVIFVFRRRRRAALSRRATTKSIAQNPEYFEGGIESSPYAIINDSFMNDPTYRGVNGSRTLDSISTTSTTLQSNVEPPSSIYDNKVARQLPDSPYTPTMLRKDGDHQYDMLAAGSRPVTSEPQQAGVGDSSTMSTVNGTTVK